VFHCFLWVRLAEHVSLRVTVLNPSGSGKDIAAGVHREVDLEGKWM
jgi:hypothetical protein